MGMSTSVCGIKPADEDYKKMAKIWNLCKESNVDIPDEVDDFFGGEQPDSKGVVVYFSNLDGVKPDYEKFVSVHNARAENGYEVDLTKVPKDIKIIRFVNSY